AVLDAGRARRQPSARQRAAVIARDRGCVGCGAPVARCQIPHVHYWRNGGPTDIANLTLLCWSCHTHVHHHGWTVHRDQGGRFTITRPAHPQPGHRQPG
ncbi:MAG: HNH endonuclease, partial [Egibacteraceae bacterium]